MTFEQYHNYLERSFDAFCKTVIRNEAINIHKQIASRAEKEIPLSSLSHSQLSELSYDDCYHPYCKTYYVRGYPVNVCDQLLAEVLYHLPASYRDVILLYYFLDYNDTDIARLLRIRSQTVANRKVAALKRLKKLMEEIDNA